MSEYRARWVLGGSILFVVACFILYTHLSMLSFRSPLLWKQRQEREILNRSKEVATHKNEGSPSARVVEVQPVPPTLPVSARRLLDPRLMIYRRQLERDIGGALSSLDLPPATLANVKAALLERWAVSLDIQEVGKEQRLSPEQIAKLTQEAQANVDSELAEKLDPASNKAVAIIVKQYVAYSQIANSFAPDMSFAGQPLSAPQTSLLADALYNTFSASVDPDAPAKRQYVEEKTGLSMLDTAALKKAASFLSPLQVEILQNDFRATTEMFRHRGPPAALAKAQ